MKKLSLGVVAVLLASAPVFAGGIIDKTVKKAKQDCHGKCIKNGKTVNCPNKAACPDKATCVPACSGKCS
ncbi:MAG: hypothetical protein ACXVB0_01340 [Mucilaginibacter sp.]